MINNYYILANGDKGFTQIIVLLLIAGFSIFTSIVKKMQEKAQEQKKSGTMAPPETTSPGRAVSADNQRKAVIPQGVSARDVLQRRKVSSSLSKGLSQDARVQKHEAARITQSHNPASLPSRNKMFGEAILIQDTPRKVVSQKIQVASQKISKVSKRRIKAQTEKTKVIPAKTPLTKSQIEEISFVEEIREMVADKQAFRKAFILHELLLAPRALRDL